MSRLTGFADLVGRSVGVFGYGIEGRATQARLATFAITPVIVDDEPLDDGVLATNAGGHEALLSCDVVLKSPGIARRRPDVLALEATGVVVTSALNLWLGSVDRSRVIGVTGTKGKSTTTSLITFFLETCGAPAQALGNIGVTPYDPVVDDTTGWLVVEISSFQCTDVTFAPGIVVVTSLGEDHVDWHGSLEQYRSDKLSLTRATGRHVTLVPDDDTFGQLRDQLGGDVHQIAADPSGLTGALGLLGEHSHGNVALALAAVATALGTTVADVRQRVLERASDFRPLRGRLTLVGEELLDGRIRYVDDGLATSALPTAAALAVFADEPVALLVGGFDRGVDYQPLVEALTRRSAPTTVLGLGPAGRRILALIDTTGPTLRGHAVETMAEAVHDARQAVRDGGVVLLSPAAPSFDAYRNWLERSEDFTRRVLAFTSPASPA